MSSQDVLRTENGDRIHLATTEQTTEGREYRRAAALMLAIAVTATIVFSPVWVPVVVYLTVGFEAAVVAALAALIVVVMYQ